MDGVLLHDGAPLKVQGFATVYGREAETEIGTEVIRPGAFSASLRSGQDVIATWAHDPYFTWASTADGSLRLWDTETGLAFEGTIESSMRGVGLANFIADGHAVASITLHPSDCVETATGREVVSAGLTEICIYHVASYPTACWLAGEAQPDNLTPRAQGLRQRWIAEAASGGTADHSSRRTPVRTMSARAQRVRALAAITDEEAFGPPPAGMTMEQWLNFGLSCAHGARWMKT